MRRHARRVVVSVALGLAMVLATASTAEAVWSAPWYLTDPTKLIIGATELDFSDPTETGCTEELPDQALGFDMQGDEEEGTWSFTGAVWDGTAWVPGPIEARFRIPNINRLFQAEVTVLASSGDYAAGAIHIHLVDPPHPANEPNYELWTTGPNHVTARMQVYELDEPDCEKDDLICTLNVRLVSVWAYSYIFDAPNHTPPGDWIQMELTTEISGGIRPVVPTGSSCDDDISAFAVGQPVAFDPITGLDP